MTERQRAIIDEAAEHLMPNVHGIDREELGALLYQFALDVMKPPALTVHEEIRRSPGAGEVLPREQRASWAREKTPYDRE